MQRLSRIVAAGTFALFVGLHSLANAADDSPQTRLKLPWETLKRLLNLDGEEVRLSWSEFQTILKNTATQQLPHFMVSKGDVLLSRSEFTRFIQNLQPPDSSIPDVYVTKAVYHAVASKESVRVQADLSVHVRERGPGSLARIDLFPSQVAFDEVTVNGQPASIAEENGRLILTTDRIGALAVHVVFSVHVPDLRTRQALSFPVARTPITQLDLRLPEPGLEVKVEGALHTQTRTEEKTSIVQAILSPMDHIALSWTPSLPATDQGPAKIYSDFSHLVSIEDDAVRVRTTLSLQILQNTIRGVTLSVPAGFTVIDVQGDGLGEWKATEGNPGKLEIPFLAMRKGALRFSMTSEHILAQDKATLPFTGFALAGSIREKGFIGVELGGSAEATVPGTQGLERVDIQELPVELISISNRPLLYGYRYLQHPYNLSLAVERHERVNLVSSVIDAAEGQSYLTEEGKWVHQVTYTLRSSWKQFLEVTLPQDAQLWSAFVEGQPVKPSIGAQNKILIPLSRPAVSRAPSFPVEIIYFQERPKLWPLGLLRVEQPQPDLLISRLHWAVTVPPDRAYYYWGRQYEQISRATIRLGTVSGSGGVGGTVTADTLSMSLDDKNSVPMRKENERAYKLKAANKDGALAPKSEFVQNALADLPQSVPQAMEQNFEGTKHSEPTVAGVLPIRVRIPITGLNYEFTKTLPDKNLPLRLPLFYLSEKILWVIRLMLAALVLAGLYRMRAHLGRFLAPWIPRWEQVFRPWHVSAFMALTLMTLLTLASVYGPPLILDLCVLGFLATLTRWLLTLVKTPDGDIL